ncbi:hypothetical protein RhiirA5_353664 [Rhizophagus irregularis]|uniref:Uncharacterized protein n=1 Tax=Rhizophagus irregularis TaxID=588596 RepID=A0A2I1DWZ1_9GLOM|nr:hypothetical protein RhiirA5_353664 [Rhizophagus irregularis]PKC75694.1 hypothetical protein RhiirA1_407288 [Rhizophagus irregularis]PKK79453.1 hypothetical protein RhiirC2_727153 [Rhizophagus irregularis]PKY14394.1 hypothetical protein RhiirB3_400244 [Rhizophagus irregularis]
MVINIDLVFHFPTYPYTRTHNRPFHALNNALHILIPTVVCIPIIARVGFDFIRRD